MRNRMKAIQTVLSQEDGVSLPFSSEGKKRMVRDPQAERR